MKLPPQTHVIQILRHFQRHWGICLGTQPQREPISINSLGHNQMQVRQILGKTIALLLAMQLFLIGFQTKSRIDQGNSSIEALIWMTQQYISVLVKIRSLQDKKEKNDSPKLKSKR
ncbi:hypothetical protein [Nostoc sp. 'Peltigera membranacea cyanobiont' 210A]|uniref:hypothetical protein n=1 Tax=Nostoc sp. 'Peltigera membranacea cyanobiont' 210A TaxID=2014529 RepID=UPI001CB8B961|nr:hypothetical protein [Nostoc sp. 'Peltigera membranacea cyanobiont' 210A]